MNKKDLAPIGIAIVAAFVITVIVRWLLPLQSTEQTGPTGSQKEITMPEIPLMEKKEVKKKKKEIDYFVLVTSKEIKKDAKLGMKYLEWKKWPGDAIQPYFIAKDEHETPMNNGSDYSNAMKRWAKTDIPKGIPLTMEMLTEEDPVAKAAKEKKKRAAEEKKKKQKAERETSLIKKGMRAVTFSVDQRSAASSNMLKPGDLVDVLIMENRDGRTKMYKYNALKILAIDGVTKAERASEDEGSLVGGFRMGSSSTPKNVTLEIQEDMVETMLKQTQNSGLILSLRSQSEKQKDGKDSSEEAGSGDSADSLPILHNILSINRTDVTNEIRKEMEQSKQNELKTEAFLSSVNTLNNIENSIEQAKVMKAKAEKEAADAAKAMEEALKKVTKKSKKSDSDSDSDSDSASKSDKPKTNGQEDPDSGGSNYEVISGKIIGEDPEKEKELESVIIYRKLTPSEVQFDENGRVVSDSYSSSSSGGYSSGGSSSRSSKSRRR